MSEPRRMAGTIIAWAAYGCVFVGIVGVLAAVLAFGDWAGVGLCLMAAAIAFGLLANASLRQ
ncbi:MAG: hypothetical protein ACRELX_06675 [Longimicrobiales bacterium]